MYDYAVIVNITLSAKNRINASDTVWRLLDSLMAEDTIVDFNIQSTHQIIDVDEPNKPELETWEYNNYPGHVL